VSGQTSGSAGTTFPAEINEIRLLPELFAPGERYGKADPDVLEGWLALGEVPARQLVFGAVGKVWPPDIDWKAVPSDALRDFAEPDLAKLAGGFSVRHYGSDRTLLSYEARTKGTDDARRKFLRYWWLVQRFVGYVMRAALVTVKDLAEEEQVPAPV